VDIAGWDEAYAESPDDWFFGREASEMARLTYQYWKQENGENRGSVLDLGSGEGRDAVHFSQKGFSVTALEGSAVGIEKTERLASELGTQIDRLILADVRDFEPERRYDIVFASNILQFLGDECPDYLARLQEQTPAGGFNAVCVFTRASKILRDRPEVYLFGRGELRRMYPFFASDETLWREPISNYLSFSRIIAVKR